MDNVAVKICGITNDEDASSAVELGAGTLGFIFAPSPRQVTPDKVRGIIRAIPPFVKTVGVFVNEGHAAIGEIKRYCGLDLVQLHGDESPDFCNALMPCAIKAIRIKDTSSLPSIKAFHGKVSAILLDTYSKNKPGGTGRTFDWELARKTKKFGIPVILAGGLGPENIDTAIQTVKPYAVDVNSAVEERPGKKSYALMKSLMDKVRKTTGHDPGRFCINDS
jgi:phosphoribosylanthranilate isomerase